MSDLVERIADWDTELALIADVVLCELKAEIERLRAIENAAKDDMECAKANCGKYGGSRNCSAWINRDLRCSDCPVEVWLGSTFEALQQENDDEPARS